MFPNLRLWVGIAAFTLSQLSLAQIDHKVALDHSGFWSHSTQEAVEAVTLATIVGGSLWEGGDSRLGRTYWQSIDSVALGAVGSTTGKYVFTRARPSQTDNPNKWFQGKGHYSFPSGEATFESAAVTDFVLEYGHDQPAVYALELLPLYVGVGRVKAQAHWQTDVLAGWALGFGSGYLAHEHGPWALQVMPHGVQAGFKTHF